MGSNVLSVRRRHNDQAVGIHNDTQEAATQFGQMKAMQDEIDSHAREADEKVAKISNLVQGQLEHEWNTVSFKVTSRGQYIPGSHVLRLVYVFKRVNDLVNEAQTHISCARRALKKLDKKLEHGTTQRGPSTKKCDSVSKELIIWKDKIRNQQQNFLTFVGLKKMLTICGPLLAVTWIALLALNFCLILSMGSESTWEWQVALSILLFFSNISNHVFVSTSQSLITFAHVCFSFGMAILMCLSTMDYGHMAILITWRCILALPLMVVYHAAVKDLPIQPSAVELRFFLYSTVFALFCYTMHYCILAFILLALLSAYERQLTMAFVALILMLSTLIPQLIGIHFLTCFNSLSMVYLVMKFIGFDFVNIYLF